MCLSKLIKFDIRVYGLLLTITHAIIVSSNSNVNYIISF